MHSAMFYGYSLAAVVIQLYWLGYVIHKGISFSMRLHTAASMIQSLWRQYHARRKTGCTETENHQFTEALRQKHDAATLIQVGLWYSLYLFCKFNKKKFYYFCVLVIFSLFFFLILLIVS